MNSIFIANAILYLSENKEKIAYTSLLIFLVISVAILLIGLIEQSKRNNVLKKTERIRTDIFRKITHEFRTPLTIISGLSRQLREQKDLSANNTITYLNAIERHGKVLHDLVNQLMDISELKSESKNLEWKTGNIVIYINMITETFQNLASQKDIEISFFSKEQEIITNFAPDYINKILYNLIGNAIKYSDSGSHIFIIVERNNKDSKKLIIKVIDHGKGISNEDLPKIFELFYQKMHDNEHQGNGIGLTLTKQVVDILGGNISVESEPGKGSTFTVELPIFVSEKELYPYWIPEKIKGNNRLLEKNVDVSEFFTNKINENDPRCTILLAEDNKDIAIFVRSMFPEDTHNILYASNGELALELAINNIPDIIITDIIMPKKSGIELCKEVKNSPLLNHIPIIIISAKSGNDDIIEGLKSGAESFIKKPFHPDELVLRVKNLLHSRDLMQQKYKRAILKPEKNITEKKDENINVEFLRLVTDIIYREIKNPNFTSNKLAQELAISVSQLNKKLNAIAGIPASSYILNIKIHHAKKILTSENKTIGEVAAECGIFDLNYFSRVFKKHTGLTPTQYSRLPMNN